MPKYLRKLDKAVWWDVPEGEPEKELIADSLKNAKTTDGKLSVFVINDDEEINLILAAVSAGKDRLSDADYCVFDEGVLEDAGVKIIKSPGGTGCTVVDDKHVDIVDLNTKSVGVFVCKAAYKGYVDSVDKKKIGEVISRMISEGMCEKAVVNPKIRGKLGIC